MTDHHARARAIAEQLRDECVDMCHGDPFLIEDATAIIAAALATVERETWEAAAREVEAAREDDTYSPRVQVFDVLGRVLRQRAKETR